MAGSPKVLPIMDGCPKLPLTADGCALEPVLCPKPQEEAPLVGGAGLIGVCG